VSPALKCPETTSTSHEIARVHAFLSQSPRPFSSSSTNRYRSGGNRWRMASFSSAELTVMVHTVCSARAARLAPGAGKDDEKGAQHRSRMDRGCGQVCSIAHA
jgi:hypothetical protein